MTLEFTSGLKLHRIEPLEVVFYVVSSTSWNTRVRPIGSEIFSRKTHVIKHSYVEVKVNHFKSKVKCTIAALSTGNPGFSFLLKQPPGWISMAV